MPNKQIQAPQINLKTYYKDYTRFRVGDIVVWYYKDEDTRKKELYVEEVLPVTKPDRELIKREILSKPIFTLTLYSDNKDEIGHRGWNPERMFRHATTAEKVLYGNPHRTSSRKSL